MSKNIIQKVIPRLLLVLTFFISIFILTDNQVSAQCRNENRHGSVYECCVVASNCCAQCGTAANVRSCTRQIGSTGPGGFSYTEPCLTTSHPSCSCAPAESCSPSVWTPGDNQCNVGSCGPCQRRTGINRSTPNQQFACSDVCVPDNTCPGCCTAVAPTAATLVSPVNNFIAHSNSVVLTFNPPTSWGNGCPNINGYRIHYRINDPVRGLGSWVIVASNISPVNLTSLEWGVRYEWGVHTVNNGSNAQTWSGSRFFTTNRPPTTTYDGISLYGNSATNQCGSQWSGRFLDANSDGQNDLITSNPVQFNMSGSDIDGDQFALLAVALLPTAGPFAENGTTVSIGTAISKANGAGSFVAGFDRRDNRGYIWSNNTQVSAPSGNLTGSGGNVTLLNIGSNTVANQIGNNVTGSVRLRFENTFPSGNYNIYIITTSLTPAGNEISEGATPSFPRSMKRVGTWGVDMVNPSVSITEPSFTSASQFSITYNHSDNISITQRLLEASATKEDSTLSNNLSQIINFTQADNFYPYPSFPASTPAVITYNDLTPSNQSSYTFRLSVTDQACNTTIQNAGAIPPLPWMIVNDGNASAGNGLSSVLIPNLSLSIPNVFSGQSYLSTFGTISGSTKVRGSRSNPNNLNLENYSNNANEPNVKSDDRNWYDHLLNRIKRNEEIVVTTQSQPIISGNISSSLSSITSEKRAFEISGNVTVNSGTICDMQAIIFVGGNLTINPDITNVNNQSACLFIVRGNIDILQGQTKTVNVDINSATLAQYDRVEAFLLANGNITLPEDTGAANRKWDGLVVNGSFVASNVTVRRDINNIGNRLQPALVINYDARFEAIYGYDFVFRGFSIREK